VGVGVEEKFMEYPAYSAGKIKSDAAHATMQTESVYDHPCDDGSHGCHDPADGGICFKVGSNIPTWCRL
jgi:hypothetical protein